MYSDGSCRTTYISELESRYTRIAFEFPIFFTPLKELPEWMKP
jgi:hypothetical protein